MNQTEASRRPHALIVNHFAMAPDMGGGTRHLDLGSELVKRGWVVTIMASDFHLYDRKYLRRCGPGDRVTHNETIDGVAFRWLHASPYERNDRLRIANWLSFSHAALREQFTRDQPSVVLGSSPSLIAALAAWRIARRLKVPFVLEVRDLWPESLAVNGRPRGAGYWTLWAISKFLSRVADQIVVLALGVAKYLEGRGVQPVKIAHIPNGSDVHRFEKMTSRNHGRIRVVYAGAHGPANGLETVLDAALLVQANSRISFLLVGDGPSKDELRARAERLGLSNVQFADAVPKREIPTVLAGCDVGLMVLKDVELFSFGVSPNKLFDYWSAGLPVVCNVRGEVAELVREAAGGIQTADATASSLAAAIRGLVELSPEERHSVGSAGRNWVTIKRSRSVLGEQLDNTLSQLIRAKGARA